MIDTWIQITSSVSMNNMNIMNNVNTFNDSDAMISIFSE